MHFTPPLLGAFLAVSVLAAADPDVVVVVDMSAEGRKLAHPSVEHPEYYLPVMRGYHEIGLVRANEPLPSSHEIVHALAPELAKDGYLVVDGNHTKADIVIDFSWGIMGQTDRKNEKEQNERIALGLGRTAMNVIPLESYGHEFFMSGTRGERYFLVLTAYDYASWSEKRSDVILWKAKMSVPTEGKNFPDVVALLAQSGGPQFGYETVNHPKIVPQENGVPMGTVKVGVPVEKN